MTGRTNITTCSDGRLSQIWRAALGLAVILLAAALQAGPAEDVQALTGGRTRIAWCRQVEGHAKDAAAQGPQLNLMGFDSADGKGVRPIIARLGNYHKPLIMAKGDAVVFTDWIAKRIRVVNWDGSELRDLAEGVAVDTWLDPATGSEWVIAINAQSLKEADAGKPVFRFPLDDPSSPDTVWKSSRVDLDNFQLSADGRRASGTFPWPDAGVADLETGKWVRMGRGCWASLAPDNSYLLWIFDGAHRNLALRPPDGKSEWMVAINGAPGMDGYEVYHPRWSNHIRFFALSGPYKGGEGENRIRFGGEAVEIHVGRFNETLTAVEGWARVTRDRFLDVYPDLWVDPAAATNLATRQIGQRPLEIPAKGVGRLEIRARLVQKTPTPTLRAIAPYKQALVAYAYEIEEVRSGSFDGKRILVAHWGIRKSKPVPIGRKIGESYTLRAESYSAHRELEGERLVIDVENPRLPLYYEVSN